MAGKTGRSRQRRRRGRFGILYKLLSFLVICSAVVAGSAIFFRVNEITVEGNSRYTVTEIIRASGLEEGDNLFLINKPQTVRSITKSLPYVEKVSVVKALPDRVELFVTESVAVGYLELDGAYWLINSGTKVVERTEDPASVKDLPQLLGLSSVRASLGVTLSADLEEQLRLDGLRELLTALDGRGMAGNVTEFLDLSSSGTISFGYGEDLTVVVPLSGSSFDRLAYSLQGVLDTCAKQGQPVTGTLDLTYGDKSAHLLTERWLPEGWTEQEPVSEEPEPEGDDEASMDAPAEGEETP